MAEALEQLVSWRAFAIGLVVFGLTPGPALRALVCLYPKGHPRRTELLGQLYAMPQWRRPWFVAEQLETAICEGLTERVARRRRLPAPDLPAVGGRSPDGRSADSSYSPYVRRLRLAAELTAARKEAGLSRKELAQLVGTSRAYIVQLEDGHLVDLGYVIRILDALGVDSDRQDRIVTLARDAGVRGWWEPEEIGARQALFADLEAGAETIREFQLTLMPALLQVPQFTHACIEAERFGADDYVPAKAVRGCEGRQRMLRRPSGPTYEVILDEVAIRRLAAPPEVVKMQLYHVVANVRQSPKVSLRVLPVNAVVGEYRLPRSAFSLYTFPDPSDPDVVVIDAAADHSVYTHTEHVTWYEELYTLLRNAALDQDASLRCLLDIADVLDLTAT